MWERSAELRERAGAVPYALSQQLLLASLATAPDEVRAVASQVRRWARALGVGILEAGAAELCLVRPVQLGWVRCGVTSTAIRRSSAVTRS